MSYSKEEAQKEQDRAIYEALDTRDSEALYKLADLLKEQGEDEEADQLLKAARKIDNEDNAYDQERDSRN